MGRMIDVDKLGLTDFEIVICSGDYKEALKMLIEKIENAPIVDVVRCKDCKWWYRNEACTVNAITVAECLYRGDVWESNEFCSDGERREDG